MVVGLRVVGGSRISIYEGDPSSEKESVGKESLNMAGQINYIATDFSKQQLFIMRNKPGNIAVLNDFNVKLTNTTLVTSVLHRGISAKLSSIALDSVHGNVYWTDSGFNWIVIQSTRTNDTSIYRVLIQDILQPQGIAVDPVKG